MVHKARRGTRSARGQGASARAAKGRLSMSVEQAVVKATREVRKADVKVKKAQAAVTRAFRAGGAGLRFKDLFPHRPGGLSRKILK